MIQPLTASIFAPKKVDLTMNGDYTLDILPVLKQNIVDAQELIRKEGKEGEIAILLDMTNFSGTYDLECMEMMITFMKLNTAFVERTAIFGATEKIALVTEVSSALAKRENIQVFPTREEAINWLNHS